MTATSTGDLSWPLHRAADLFASAVALVGDERTVTYAELATRVGALAAALDELGVAPGGRVGFLGVNSLAHVECLLGVPAAGRVLVDLNLRLAEAELAFIASDCGIEVLVVDRDQFETARALRASCSTIRELVLDGGGAVPGECLSYEQLIARDPRRSRSSRNGASGGALTWLGQWPPTT